MFLRITYRLQQTLEKYHLIIILPTLEHLISIRHDNVTNRASFSLTETLIVLYFFWLPSHLGTSDASHIRRIQGSADISHLPHALCANLFRGSAACEPISLWRILSSIDQHARPPQIGNLRGRQTHAIYIFLYTQNMAYPLLPCNGCSVAR